MTNCGELNEQELEQTAGGESSSDLKSHIARELPGRDYVLYRCPNCGATKKGHGVGSSNIAPLCDKCHLNVQMVKV